LKRRKLAQAFASVGRNDAQRSRPLHRRERRRFGRRSPRFRVPQSRRKTVALAANATARGAGACRRADLCMADSGGASLGRCDTARFDETRARAEAERRLLQPRADAEAGYAKDLPSFGRGNGGPSEPQTWVARGSRGRPITMSMSSSRSASLV
jgi:hypothetical protein